MNYYIASGLKNVEAVRLLRARIDPLARGRITYDWTEHGLIEDDDDRPIVAEKEISGVIQADVVFVLLPGGRGTHVELGVAIAMRRRIILIGTDEQLDQPSGYPCVFYRHPRVVRARSVEHAVKQYRMLTAS